MGGSQATQLQRAVTQQREYVRDMELNAVAAALPKGDRRKLAFYNTSSTVGLYATTPTPGRAVPPAMYSYAVSAFFGIQVPGLGELVGRRIGEGTMVVDSWGWNLALARGLGGPVEDGPRRHCD